MKRGFTLVELLAVIIILSVLAVLLVPTVSRQINIFQDQAYEDQIKMIELAAENWGTDNPYDLPDTNEESIVLTLRNLKDSGYLEQEIKNPKTGDDFPNTLKIKITYDGYKYTYKVLD